MVVTHDKHINTGSNLILSKCFIILKVLIVKMLSSVINSGFTASMTLFSLLLMLPLRDKGQKLKSHTDPPEPLEFKGVTNYFGSCYIPPFIWRA